MSRVLFTLQSEAVVSGNLPMPEIFQARRGSSQVTAPSGAVPHTDSWLSQEIKA
jgi:hypothetical protein